MRSAVSDRVLRVLVAVWVGETLASMVLSLTGLAGPARTPGRFEGTRGWLGLTWFLLLVVIAWRSARHLRRLSRLLASRDERIAGVAATSHDWLWEATPELVATYCSPGIAEILGRRPDDIVGRSFTEFVVEADRPKVAAILDAAIGRGDGWDDVELSWIHADGHAVVLQGSAVPVRDARGNLVGFRGTRRLAPAGPTQRQLAAIRQRVGGVLAARSLRIALQPITCVHTGGWVGVEALARFPDGRRPDLWFSEAHQAGLGLDLELLAVTAALTTAADLPPQVFISVNASPALIGDHRLTTALDQAGVPPQRIVIELTEHVAVDSYESIAAALAPLRRRGVRLAIDDTGAGYASFSHVLALHPDIIKLDRSLITDIDTDAARRTLVTAIVLLALELDASITAEGVENMPELSVLASLGIDHAQGYLLARPTPDPACWRGWRDTTWPTGTLGGRLDSTAPHVRPQLSDSDTLGVSAAGKLAR